MPTDMITAIRSLLRQYIEAKSQFLATSERCLQKGWPDRKIAIRNAIRLKILQGDLELLRFDYVVRHQSVEPAACKSLASIMDRLYKDWRDSEEVALKEENPNYRELMRELGTAEAERDPAALDGPLAAVRGDREYVAAANALRMRHHEFDEQLGKLVATHDQP
jgi:hypothetical protein